MNRFSRRQFLATSALAVCAGAQPARSAEILPGKPKGGIRIEQVDYPKSVNGEVWWDA